ncbi:MAG TPA: redoxin domain-containing protein [Chitinophagaceae bacterium]|nr:redoxin domain-containing protein [Chitinophagaceae bacterium]
MLAPGTLAPDFELSCTPDQKLKLSELRGKKIILAFYPADWSPVCSDQMSLYNEIVAKVELFKIKEGKCVQALHEGPFENEAYTLNRIEEYAETQGLVKNGYHHEIYLVNFAKEKNKNKYRTILREPVKSK